MFDVYSDGYCPQCALNDKEVEMLLNQGDCWECPVCRLQAMSSKGGFMILRERGNNNLKASRVSATTHVVGFMLLKESSENPLHSGGWVENEADLREFLENVKYP